MHISDFIFVFFPINFVFGCLKAYLLVAFIDYRGQFLDFLQEHGNLHGLNILLIYKVYQILKMAVLCLFSTSIIQHWHKSLLNFLLQLLIFNQFNRFNEKFNSNLVSEILLTFLYILYHLNNLIFPTLLFKVPMFQIFDSAIQIKFFNFLFLCVFDIDFSQN